ncbi:MAG: thioesterase [Alphaproteobacteria bacterium]|nr:MAG: thioesterase [Alphaproteobacteria bacterium]
MKDSLKPGVSHRFVYRVPREKTVPFLYPEAPAFQAMPEVFATGYMVGLMEWASVELLKPHLDEGVEGRRVWFKIHANDGVDTIGEGRHERAVVIWNKFNARVAEKAVKQ